jgi:NarL family two-component system response regulator LiaR
MSLLRLVPRVLSEVRRIGCRPRREELPLSFEMESDDVVATLRVIVADADPLARRTLREMLADEDVTVIAEATTHDEAVQLAAFYRPDVALIDEGLVNRDGAAATKAIHARSPGVAVIIVSGAPDDERAIRALRAGASGYLSKEFGPEVLLRVVRGVVDGEAAVSRRLAMRVIESDRQAPRGGRGMRPVRSELTDREWEVLDLLVSGASTDDVARTLVLSTETVRSHVKNLYRKLGVRSRDEAIEAARRLRDLVM